MVTGIGALESRGIGRFQRKVAMLSGVGMFLDGFDVTVIAVALPVLSREWGISGFTSGLVGSSVVAGMLVGGLVMGRVADLLGRRKMYLIDLAGFVIFALLTALSQNVWQLVLFRFLLGLCIGADYPISSGLTAEFSATRNRGRLIMAMSVMWQIGALVAYFVGLALLPVGNSAWRWMLLAGAVVALVTLLFRVRIPESPRWLRARGRHEEAAEVMRSVTGDPSWTPDPAEADTAVPSAAQPTRWRALFSRPLIAATVFVCTFWFAFDVAYYGISMYTPTVLGPLTGGSNALAYVGSAIVALLGVAGAALGMLLVEQWGRRVLVIGSFASMIVTLGIIALLHAPGLAVLVGLLAVTILLTNVGLSLDMVYPNELFPTGVRAAGTGLAHAVSRVGAILGVLVFPTLAVSWGFDRAMVLFIAAAVLGLVVSVVLAPETKGRSLEQLTELETSTSARNQLGPGA